MSIALAAKVKGLSEPAFLARFGTKEQCLDLLIQMRWGGGFACARCGSTSYARMRCRKQVQCNRSKHQVGFPAGTVFHRTKLSLTSWFLAIYHHVSPKHVGAYLASFAWRFNRRYQLDTLTERLLWAALKCMPRTYRLIIAG